MGTTTLILRLLDLLVAGSVAHERFAELRQRLAVIKAEGRDPTDAEWEELFSTIESDSARLDAADKRLNPGDNE